MPQLSYSEFCLARVQHLLAHEKDQVQDFRNWVSSVSEGTSRSAPDSPVTRLIETPAASFPSADTAEKPTEPSPETSDTPAAAERASKGGGSGSSGSKGPSVRLVPFQSMPQSAQEELGNELFDDLLLSLDNMKKLADCMQWSFRFTSSNY